MLFQVYGDNAVFQWIGWAIVFIVLILVNEFARRSKAGGIICFLVLPAVLTVILHRDRNRCSIGRAVGT